MDFHGRKARAAPRLASRILPAVVPGASQGVIPMESARALVETDHRFLIHPLHFAKDHETPMVLVEGKGEMLIDADGKKYIDGLSSLWNVNAGHGRKELADAAG